MKIALVGSAPSSISLAPFDDASWTIWGCSPGAYPHLRRVDAFFEIHRWRPGEYGFSPDYIAWLAKQTCPIYTIDRVPEVPASVPYPTADILAKYPGLGRSFFTSSLAWMLALAIDQIEAHRGIAGVVTADTGLPPVDEQDEIGLWGVDMAASDEYGHQKPGCHFFIREAELRGIKVTVPPQSDLLMPLPLYGIGEASPHRIKLDVRKQELEQRLGEVGQRMAAADKAYQDARGEQFFLQGALDDLQYHLNTWAH